jgi:hypothetical protein
MAAEGVFPKVDGDILYASEVNSFNANGRYIAAGSYLISSGTNYFIVGSHLISGLGNPTSLEYFFTGSGAIAFSLSISGLAAESKVNVSGLNVSPVGRIQLLFGSPMVGIGQAVWNSVSDNKTQPFSAATNYINNIYPGSPFVIGISGLTNMNGSAVLNYFITAGGRY